MKTNPCKDKDKEENKNVPLAGRPLEGNAPRWGLTTFKMAGEANGLV